uniref:Dynein_C domain-containing protein n=1 Tax=Strongyloides papillosus TaxID=174720 RepID=A0A0N5C4V9_STREA
YVLPKNVTVALWMSDFVERVSQLVRLSKSDNLRSEEIWLGGMFAPEAYIIATRKTSITPGGADFWKQNQEETDEKKESKEENKDEKDINENNNNEKMSNYNQNDEVSDINY